MPTLLTYHCKLCDKRFYNKRNGKKGRVYCSRKCLAKDLIAGKDSHLRWSRVNDKKHQDNDLILAFREGEYVLLDAEILDWDLGYTHDAAAKTAERV